MEGGRNDRRGVGNGRGVCNCLGVVRPGDVGEQRAVNYLDLFSGIGGFALGAYWAGMRFDKHYFSEVDDWATKLYQKRFPDAIPLGDIRGIDGKALADSNVCNDGGVQQAGELQQQRQSGTRRERTATSGGGRWILTGGFPCQDISFAGKGAGLEGERSGLWWEYHRLIGELRPRFAIVENVAALTVRGIDVVLGSLAEIGFDAEWDSIRASDVGAPHRRDRIWIVAYPQEFPERPGLCEGKPGGQRGRRPGNSSGEVADTESKRVEGSRAAGQQESGVSAGKRLPGRDGAGQGTADGAVITRLGGRLDGLPGWLDGWEEGLPRLATGVPNRVDRLRGLGNAIVPQIAQLLFTRIKEVIDE